MAAPISVTPRALATSNGGSSHSPPNSPPGARRTSTISPARSIHTAVHARSGSSWAFLRFATIGNAAVRPVACARHAVASGQARQRGDVGVHTVAPSSMRPWLRSPGANAGGSAAISAPAIAQIAFAPAVDLMSSSIANARASTRETLPSTSGARSPNAIDAIAPAVYGPMPGTARSSLARDGNAPAPIALAPAWRLRARE